MKIKEWVYSKLQILPQLMTLLKNNVVLKIIILKTSLFGAGKIIIPRELKNLRDTENQLRTK